jgi:hypothetical protein
MIMKVAADPAAMERWSNAEDNRETLTAIADMGKARGATRHLFAGGDGEVLVIDEWPDEESFRGFFADQQAQIGSVMQSIGVTTEPEITFYRKLKTPDVF